MITQMLTEIQELKEVSLAGYIRKGNFNGNAMAGMIVPMEESDAFKGPMGMFHLVLIVSTLIVCLLFSFPFFKILCRLLGRPSAHPYLFSLPP